MAVFSAIAAIIGMVPVVESWFQDFVTWYISQKIAAMKQQDIDVVKKALADHDQRGVEALIGDSRAGKLSGIDGTVVVDSIAGVPGPTGDKKPG